MATAKDCHTLTSFYIREFESVHKRRPVVNRHKARWGFDSILHDMSLNEAKSLIEFYLGSVSTHGHSLDWFFNNYDKLIVSQEDYEKDEAERQKLRAESKRRVEEWLKRNGNNGSQGTSSSLQE